MTPHRGVIVLNLHSGGKKRQRDIDDAHLAFTQVFSSVRVIPARDSKPNGGNMIMIGSMAAISSQHDLERMIHASSSPRMNPIGDYISSTANL